MVEREGKVRALAVENTRAETIMPIVKRYVIENSEVFTDELSSYSSLAGKGYIHSVVHHQEKEYVVGDSYTNTIEGFWSQFRRMVYGIYHYVSKKYLQRYIDEEVYRWNTKKAKAGVRFAYMFGMCAGAFDYRKEIIYFLTVGGRDYVNARITIMAPDFPNLPSAFFSILPSGMHAPNRSPVCVRHVLAYAHQKSLDGSAIPHRRNNAW